MTRTGSSSRIAAFSSPLASRGVRRRDDLQPRRVGEPALEALRVLRGELVAGAVGRADDERAAHLAAEHVAPIFAAWLTTWSIATRRKLRVMISTTGRSPEHRRADARADEALLGDRGVADAVWPELVEQAGGDLVGAARRRRPPRP